MAYVINDSCVACGTFLILQKPGLVVLVLTNVR